MFFGKDVLKICSKFIGKYPYQVWFYFTLQHGCSLVNLLQIFWTSFYMNTSGGLQLNRSYTEAHSQTSQISKMEIFAKTINGFQLDLRFVARLVAALMSLLITLSMFSTIFNTLTLLWRRFLSYRNLRHETVDIQYYPNI